jgi:DNA-binding NtrC family response regulator
MTAHREIIVLSASFEDRLALAQILRTQDFEPIYFSTIGTALEALQKGSYGLAFCDKTLPDGTYRDLLAAIRLSKTRARVVVTSHHADWDEYLEAMRLGAFDVIAVPFRPTDVEWMVIQAKRDERVQAYIVPAQPASAPVHQAAARSASLNLGFSHTGH